MKLYEITLPLRDNSGRPLPRQHQEWCDWVLNLAGGYTKLPTAAGAWRDGAEGKTYYDDVVCYRLACHEATFRRLLTEAFNIFSDQAAIFTAEIGTGTIHRRSQKEIAL